MHQQNITSCAKQELQPNMNQVKPIHFQEILSTSIDGQLVTNHLLSPPPKEKEEKKSVRLQYLKKKKRFLYYDVVLEKLEKSARTMNKT